MPYTTSTNGQFWLLSAMQKQGYYHDRDITNQGACLGVASMAAKAVLCRDINTFDQRIHQIAEEKDNVDFNVLAFFDGVAIHQDIEWYPQLFAKNSSPKNQDQTLALSILPQQLEEQGGIDLLAKFSGLYSKIDLINYLRTFENTITDEQPIVLILTSADHAITVNYNLENNGWLLIDANELPTQKIRSPENIAEKIISAFYSRTSLSFTSNQDCAAIFSEIYCVKSNTSAPDAITAWMESDSWKKLHAFNIRKVNRTDDTCNASWLFIAAKSNDLVTIKKIIANQETDPNLPSLKNKLTPLHAAARYEYIEIAEELLRHPKIDINQTDWQGETALFLAAKYGNKQIIQLFIENGANPEITCEISTRDLYLRFGGPAVNRVAEGKKLLNGCISINAAEIAQLHGYEEIVELLSESKVQLNLSSGL